MKIQSLSTQPHAGGKLDEVLEYLTAKQCFSQKQAYNGFNEVVLKSLWKPRNHTLKKTLFTPSTDTHVRCCELSSYSKNSSLKNGSADISPSKTILLID